MVTTQRIITNLFNEKIAKKKKQKQKREVAFDISML